MGLELVLIFAVAPAVVYTVGGIIYYLF